MFGVNLSSAPVIGSEVEVASGDLTAGSANAYAFAWQNPESVAIIVSFGLIDITTAGGTGSSVMSVGSGATATTASDNLIDDDGGIDLNAPGVYNSINHAGTNGASGLRLDENGGTTDWITGRILTQNAASLVGKYYIFYVKV